MLGESSEIQNIHAIGILFSLPMDRIFFFFFFFFFLLLLHSSVVLFLCFFFCLFRAVPTAYGGSQSRG